MASGNTASAKDQDSEHGQSIIDRAEELNKQTWEIVDKLRVVRGKLLPSSRPEPGDSDMNKTEQSPANFVERMRSVQDGQAKALGDLRRILMDLEKF